MKVVHISTYDKTGGAAKACWRLADALCRMEVNAKLVVQHQETPHPMVINANKHLLKKSKAFVNEASERIFFMMQSVSKDIRFGFSLFNTGQDISQVKAVQEADIIHLHWMHKGFISFQSLEKLFQLNKPIVWTIHDMWAFTGGCHYSGGCNNFKEKCGSCWYLKNSGTQDLSAKILANKAQFFANKKGKLVIVSPSAWLQGLASQSPLLENIDVINIPNTINTKNYRPADKLSMRYKLKLPLNKRLILFIAMNVNDKRKGFLYLKESLDRFKELKGDQAEEIELVVMGKVKRKTFDGLPFKINYLGNTGNQQFIIDAYNACDLVAIPSLEDNLPNTALEALACGKPVVAFETGGIPEIIRHHKNGFLAPVKNTEAFAQGLKWILEDEERYFYLTKIARKSAVEQYDYEVICSRFHQLYKKLLEEAKLPSSPLVP